MGLGTVRTTVGRLVVIAVLVLTIGAGSVAVSQTAHTSAMPLLTCRQAMVLANYWTWVGDDAYSVGDYAMAAYAYGKASGYFDWC